MLLGSLSLGAGLLQRTRRGRAPDRSRQVIMRAHPRGLYWQGEHEGPATRVEHEPDANAWVRVARHIPPIERLL